MESLPHSDEAEQVVLGCLLLDGSVYNQFLLNPDDFYREDFGRIYEVMQNLERKGVPISLLTVGEELKSDLAPLGGYTYLAKMMEKVVVPSNFYYYAKIVKEKSLARQMFLKATEVEASALAEDMASAKSKANEIVRMSLENDIPLSELFTEEDMERLSKSKRFTSKRLEKLTHFVWFMKKEVIYIAGQTSTGKSQLAINLAMDFLEQGARVGYLSFELGKEQLLKRLISWDTEMGLSEIDIRQKEWFDFGKQLLTQNFFKNFYFRDDIFDIEAVMAWIESHDLEVVFLDYIQMMHEKGFRGSRNEEIGNIAREFRRMSNKRCMVVLSQFNRRDSEDENEIDLSRIRDSGEIEQTSTSIILIRRDKAMANDFYYCVAKNQSNGRLTYGWVPIEFKKGGKFKEVADGNNV